MSITNRTLNRSDPEYDKDSEDRFRRDLENYLYEVVSQLRSVYNGTDTGFSLQSKREGLLIVPPGIQVVS